MAEGQQQRYRVIDRLAAGGMAEVYRAESAGLEGFKKKVAIKRVLPHLSEKKRFIKMFLDEARLGAYLSHSNCVQVFDIGVGDNTYFIVMEYVDGADLKAVIEWVRKQGRSFPTAYAVYITMKICEGLAYAHDLTDENGRPLGIVHRDLSPPNVLITKFGEVKIVDFGLAKASIQLEKSEPGIIKGKFSYLSPEAAMGKDVDLRTDIFAAGIILWEMLAGRKLFQGESDFETVKQVQRAEVPPISRINPTVDTSLEAIINRSLARDPATRYATARDFCKALTQWLFATNNSVTPFEIAELVQNVTRERQRAMASKAEAIDIGSLIQQTLFEFTSVQQSEQSSPNATNKPLTAGKGATISTTDWGAELDSDLGLHIPKPTPSAAIDGGVLARQLEGDLPSASPISAAKSSSQVEQPSQPLAAQPSSPPASLVATKPKGASPALLGGVVVLLALLGMAGAYVAGWIK
ncbi:MAG: protein kinase [Myxococcales bacterium]|nr:protein kinase [Polyangiaceae bacterium]MDW8247746.1 protein kinase [Myxococcales bacterium]